MNVFTLKNRLKLDQAKGLCLNVSLRDDPTKVYWSYLIGHLRYLYVGVYEGACKYHKGVRRSEWESIMSTLLTGLYFNAVSRELLVKRILELSGEGYSFEKFYLLLLFVLEVQVVLMIRLFRPLISNSI